MGEIIKILSELVEKREGHREVDVMIIHKELNFIERRQLENYFLVAHKLVVELKRDGNVIIGPGWGRMISSHFCYSLGITNISPRSVDVDPILIWGDDNGVPTIEIEVDEESYQLVFQKAIELFGYENVARMPVMNKENRDLSNHSWLGIKANGEKVSLHACALLICLDGVETHFDVDEVTDMKGNKILCAKEFVEDCDNQKILLFNVLTSDVLTWIKRIQKLLDSNGKGYPKLYEKTIREEDYTLFYQGDLNDIPDFDSQLIQEITKKLMPPNKRYAFETLLNIQALYLIEKLYQSDAVNNFLDEKKLAEYRQKHEAHPFLIRHSYGFLFAEDAAWWFHCRIGLPWVQTTKILQAAIANKEQEVAELKQFYLRQGTENGFKESDLKRIWDSLFSRTLIRSKAHLAGRLYLSVYLARLKNEFPEEFSTTKEEFVSFE